MKIFKNLTTSFIFSALLHLTFFALMVASFPFSISKPKINSSIKITDIKTHHATNKKLKAENLKQPERIISAGLVSKKLIDQAFQRQKKVEQAKRLHSKREMQKLQNAKKQLIALNKKAKLASEKAKFAKNKALAAKEAEKKAQYLAKLANEKLQEAKKEELAAKSKAKKQLQQAKTKAQKELQQAKLKANQELQKAKARADAELKKAKAIANKFEQERVAAQKQWVENEFSRYVAQIKDDVLANRTLSSAFADDLVCKIQIKLNPKGTVTNVTIVKSSGNQAYDYSSKAAVYKAAPFDMPDNPVLNKRLSGDNIVLIFKRNENS